MDKKYFPLFIDISDKKVTVAGGGKVALRRVKTLLAFGASVCVIAPEVREEFEKIQEGHLRILKKRYEAGDAAASDFVLAATDDRETNRAVAEECRNLGIPVNVSDDSGNCDFLFPSVVMTDEAVIGINSGGRDPSEVKRLRRQIEDIVQPGSSLYDD